MTARPLGRPVTGNPRNNVTSVRFDDEEQAAAASAAEEAGMPLGTWLRKLANDASGISRKRSRRRS